MQRASTHLTATPDGKSADVIFVSHEWADGVSYYAGTGINMDFDSHTECKGHVLFTRKTAVLDAADCTMQLQSVPKAGQQDKLSTPDSIRELLR